MQKSEVGCVSVACMYDGHDMCYGRFWGFVGFERRFIRLHVKCCCRCHL